MSLAARTCAVALLCLPGLSLSAQTNVLTQHNDIGRTGQNLTETILTPANVSSGNFGLLTSLSLDGPAYAQPLYMTSLNIGGVNHSVVFVATNHDSVYAWDAGAGGQLLWKVSLFDTAHGAAANAIPDPVPDTGCVQVNGPENGVMGTPVIDPATNTMYVVSKTYEGNYPVQRLHALDVTNGAEKFGGPVTIQATVAGTGSGSVNGQLSFDPKWEMQRPGLLLLNGTVYIAFGSMCDFATWHGWVMGYNAATLAQTAAFVTSPNGAGSGVWMSGAGLAADNENGVPRIFTATGNGTFDATAPYGTNTMDYGDDIIALNLSNGIKVTDAFTPSNQLYFEQSDLDVSSGGVVVLPDNLPGSSVPHELVQMNKAGVITVLNRDNLGGYNSTDQVLQEFDPTIGFGSGLWGMPAYWNGNLYVWPSHAPNYNLLQYQFKNGLLGTSPVATTSQSDTWQSGQFLGASPSVSANQNSNGILWVADTGAAGGGAPQYFYALDATNVANTLWSSTANPRDNAGIEQHCVFPTIADGRVFLEATGQFLVYGLLDFTMSPPSSVAVNPGNNTPASIALTSSTSFTQGVSFAASRLPSGVSASFLQAAGGAATVTFTAAANTAAGTTNVTITGTRGTTTETSTVSLTVGGLTDFILSAGPATVNQGTTGFSAVTATAQNGFSAVPVYTVTSVPTGLSASLAGCSATGCTLLTTASPVLTPGSYPITVQATSGALVHNATATVTVTRTAAVNVDMSKSYNVNAIASNGTAPISGGLDQSNNDFSANLLGTSLTWAGSTFKFGPANALDAASANTVTLPSGNFVNLQILSSGGPVYQQPITVTYTDGSKSTFSQSFSNWGGPSNNPGEFVADTMAYRVLSDGTTQNGTWDLYGYIYPLNSAKTVQSIALAPTRSVVVLAMSLSSSAATPQTIIFPAVGAQQLNGSLTLSAAASSGLAVSYSSTTTNVCTVAASTASLVSAGTCTITANQGGNSLYAAATPVSQNFTVGTTSQTITFATIATQTVGAPLALTATASSGLAVSYASSTASVCSVASGTATFLAAGTCSIVASQAGNATYSAAAPVTQSFLVSGIAEAISFGAIPTQTLGTTLTLTAAASSGLAVSYASSTASVCTVSSATATLLAAGTCTVTASQAGSGRYAAATPVTQSFAVQAPSLAGYDVILLVGQSNMVGEGTGADDQGDAAPDPRIFQWNHVTNTIVPAIDPLYQNQGPGSAALPMTFAKGYVKRMAPNRKLLLVGAATGGTGFAPGYWIAGTGAGATTALSWINAAMAGAGANAHLAGIVWHQGEADIVANGGSAYQTNLNNLITYFRSNITGATSATPFVVGEMTNPWMSGNLSNSNYVTQQTLILNDFHSLPDSVPYTAWTSSSQLTSDALNGSVHFSALAQRQFGRRYSDKFFEAQNNLPQPQFSQKWWAGTFYDDGRGLGAANTNSIPVNNPATVSGTVTAAVDPVRGNVAQISQGGGYLSYQVPGATFNGSYTKMAWFLPGATAGITNNLISANNSGQIHYLDAYNQGSGQLLLAAGHSSGAVSNIVSAQVTNPVGAWMNVALVYNATAQTMVLYVNGAVIASQSGVAPAPSSSATTLPVYVGSYGTLGYGIDGEIAGSRVWNTALTAAQVAGIYNYESIGTANQPGFGIVAGAGSDVAAFIGGTYFVPSLSIPAASGSTALEPIVVVPNNGFAGAVSLSVAGLPAGLGATFVAGKTANSYTLQLSATSSITPGTYALSVVGSAANNVTAQAALTLTVVNTANEIPVNLSSVFNHTDTFVTDGSSFSAGSVDGQGYAYSANLLGATLVSPNGQFTLGPANALDSVVNATIPLPAGNFSSISLLGTSLGNLTGQTFTVTYTDGSTSVFTQSTSSWCGPQQYPGEAIAIATGYRDYANGTSQGLNCYLFSYGFALNPAKVAQSVTLPNTTAVLILAVTVTGQLTTGPSFTIADSPASVIVAAGTTATSTITVTGKNGFTGAVNYTATGLPSGVTASFANGSVAGTTVLTLTAGSSAVSGSSTITISGTSGSLSAATTLALTVTGSGSQAPIAVNLSSAFNVYGIFNSGTAPTHGGLDATSYAYAGSTLPGVTLAGAPVTFGPVGAPDAVANTTVALPKGQYGSISLLAGASYGPLANQTFVVTYSDGTTSTFTQNMSDWGNRSNYAGETTVVTDPQRIIPSGALQAGPWYMYGYTFALNSAKTVSSIALPARLNVFVFAITLTPPSNLTAQTITFAPIASQTTGSTLALTATATSGAVVTFASSTSSVCTVSAATASLVATGTCSITASQAGNSTYAAAPSVTQSFSVVAATASQTISFNSIATQTVGTSLALNATASSGLTVSFASSTPSVCTVSNSMVSFVAAGACSLTASQAGNGSYTAATPVTQSFTVQAAGSNVAGYDVVLLVGQSNMVGLGTGADDAGDAAADPRILQWNAGLGFIRPAFDPLNQNSGPYNIGLGMTFAKAYVKHMAPNRKLLLVGAATGATGFAGGYWLPPSGSTAGGTGATTALSWVNAAMAAAGANAHFVGILWHQGENDIAYGGSSAYQTNLQNLISYFRTNITGASATTPFIAGEMVNPWLTYNLTASSSSAAAQITVLNDFHALPDTVPYTAWTSAAQLASDPYYSTIHFSALSQRQFGRRYADKFFEAQNNLPQPQVSQKWWAGVFYDDGRGLGSANTNSIPVNNPATVTGTVTAAIDPVRGNVAQISQGNGYLTYQVPGSTFNGSYTKMVWFLPGTAGYTNNLISANNSGQIHYLYASNVGNGSIVIAAGHSSGAVSNNVSAQVTNPAGAWMNIALAYNATAQTMSLYLNGAVIASQSGVVAAPSSSAGTLPVFVGSYGTQGYGIDGEVAGSRVWMTALSGAQVAAIYNYEATGTGNEPGFGIVVGAASQAAYSPAAPGVVSNVPALVAAAGGAGASLPVTVVPNNGFTGSPTLALSGLPTGASYTLTPASTANAYTLQITGLPATSVAGGYPLVLSGTSKTVNAQAAASLCLSVPDSAGNLHVDLSCFFNHGHNLVSDGMTFTDGGLAGTGYAFSANLLGSTVTSNGVQFSLGAPNGLNGLSAATVNLPAGQYSSLALLATGINGAQTAQTFTVTYSDGTTSTFTQSLSDWGGPANYSGETVAASMSYADVSNGTQGSGGTFHLYSYAFALNSAKTVASITTPSNNNVITMAMTLKH